MASLGKSVASDSLRGNVVEQAQLQLLMLKSNVNCSGPIQRANIKLTAGLFKVKILHKYSASLLWFSGFGRWQVSPSEFKWDQVNPPEIKWVQVNYNAQ